MLGKRMLEAASKQYRVLKADALKRGILPENNAANNSLNQSSEAANRKKKRFWHKYSRGIFWRKNALKGIYFVNFLTLILGVAIINQRQNSGEYMCGSITVSFGDSIWKHALVRNNTVLGSVQSYYEKALVYSFFNGEYIRNGTFNGYPRYTEQNKMNGNRFKETIPAEFVYCSSEERWVFTHQDISKREDDIECPWLFRSPKTREYNLVDVPSDGWSVFTGTVTPGNDFSILCNECEVESDCNYHGTVSSDATCNCDQGYYGEMLKYSVYFGLLIEHTT